MRASRISSTDMPRKFEAANRTIGNSLSRSAGVTGTLSVAVPLTLIGVRWSPASTPRSWTSSCIACSGKVAASSMNGVTNVPPPAMTR